MRSRFSIALVPFAAVALYALALGIDAYRALHSEVSALPSGTALETGYDPNGYREFNATALASHRAWGLEAPTPQELSVQPEGEEAHERSFEVTEQGGFYTIVTDDRKSFDILGVATDEKGECVLIMEHAAEKGVSTRCAYTGEVLEGFIQIAGIAGHRIEFAHLSIPFTRFVPFFYVNLEDYKPDLKDSDAN
jgi:hypothetical protein